MNFNLAKLVVDEVVVVY